MIRILEEKNIPYTGDTIRQAYIKPLDGSEEEDPFISNLPEEVWKSDTSDRFGSDEAYNRMANKGFRKDVSRR